METKKQKVEIPYEKITPVENRILIKVINKVEDGKTENGVKLREIATKKMLDQEVKLFETTMAMNNCGKVCAASVDCAWVASDDVVFYGNYAGTTIMIESEEHVMIRESDVLFILKP